MHRMKPTLGLRVLLLWSVLCASGAGCQATKPGEGVGSVQAGGLVCRNAVQGSRYALCGKLTSTGLGSLQAAPHRVQGSLDARAPSVKSRYAIQEASFHAQR